MTRLQFSAIIAVFVLALVSDPIFGDAGPWSRQKPTPAPTSAPTTTVYTTTAAPTTSTQATTPKKTPAATVASLGTTTAAATKKTPYTRPRPKKTTAQPTVAALQTSPVPTTTQRKAQTTAAVTTAKPTTIKKLPVVTTAAKTIAPTPAPAATTTAKIPAPAATTAAKTPAPAATTIKPTRKPNKSTPLPKVNFDCSNKNDGYYPDPKDKCSSIYYACVGGSASKMDCGAGDLVYEPESNSCERRHDSFRCTGTRKTTPPTTPQPSPPTTQKVPLDCDKLDDGWYADPKSKCSRIFYSCSNGFGSKFQCPGQMYFDPDSRLCLAYEDVVACAGTKRPTTPTTPTAPTPSREKLPVDCTALESGNYPDPQKKCSQIYYVCSNGEATRGFCPQGTYFDAKQKLCDYYDNVFACSGKNPTKAAANLTTVAPKPSIASLPSSEFDCTNKTDKSYLPPSKKCSTFYYRCVGGITYKAKCPAGLYYDLKRDLCDRWINIYDCSGKYPTSPLPTTPSTAGPTPEKLPIDCAKYVDGDYPDPQKKCSTVYYTCMGGLGVNIGYRRYCPPGTYFDKDADLCDIREHIRDCNGKRPVTQKTTARVPIVTTKSPYDCEKRPDGNYPAAKCAPNYWSCVGGSTLTATCPKGTFYDREKNECGFKQNIPDCGGVRPTITSAKP